MCAPYLVNCLADFNQICMDITLGHDEELIRLLRDLNCQIWAKRCLYTQYLMNQLSDFNQICMDVTFGHDKKLNRYQSLNRLPIWNSQNCSMFPLAFVAGRLQGHWWGFISRNYVVWPTFLLMNVFIALKGSHVWFLFGELDLIFKDTARQSTKFKPKSVTKFASLYKSGRINSWLDFGDLDLIFKVTASWLKLSPQTGLGGGGLSLKTLLYL